METFFNDLSSLVSDVERRTRDNVEYLKDEIDTAIEHILYLKHDFGSSESLNNLLILFQVISQELFREINNFSRRSAILSCTHTLESTGQRGRPKCIIDRETLVHLRNLNYQWKEIASMFLVSRWTISRRVKELGIGDLLGYSNITDEELDRIVRDFKLSHGISVGRSLVTGHLRSLGIRVQQKRVAESLSRVDPDNSRLRWSILIRRRSYSVPGPNSLWHIDGHHSLIRWGFVIHGAIDGFSRLITFPDIRTKSEQFEPQIRKKIRTHS